MRICSASTALSAMLYAALLGLASAQRSFASINTRTIPLVTASVQVPTGSVAEVSETTGIPTITQTGQNVVIPSTVTQATTANAPSIATSSLTAPVVKPTMISNVVAQDLFQPVANDDPRTVLGRTDPSFRQPKSVDSSYQGASGLPIGTNNFYNNLITDSQVQPIYAMPYAMYYDSSNGMCVQNSPSSDYGFGGSFNGDPSYYFAPVRRCPIGVGASEVTSGIKMTVGNIKSQSVDVTFAPQSGSGSMTSTILQGGALLTWRYKGLTPRLFTNTAAFISLAPVALTTGSSANGLSKWRVNVNNGDTWVVYAVSSDSSSPPTFSLVNNGAALVGSRSFNGVIQIGKLPVGFTAQDEAAYDAAVGTYATAVSLTGSATGTAGSYTFNYAPVQMLGNALLTYLYPHQQASVTAGAQTSLKLWSTTKGLMRAYAGNVITMSETNLPTDISFLPWSPLGNLQSYPPAALKAIAAAANSEVAQDMYSQCYQNSMYFSGKSLAKFAQICLVTKDVLNADPTSCLNSLKNVFGTFIAGTNLNPLAYDNVWKGAISSCGDSSQTAQQSCDFGNAVYNDHHFHYGYHVYTAAVIAHLDSTWLSAGKNKAWINTLIRDYANPSASDSFFPQSRSFDWFSGHSWARGIVETADGRDEESSSEDYMSIYAIKLWGKVTGDASMEARSNLQLSIIKRAMASYMLLGPDNTVMPSSMINNYVAGITFENKIDHTTYFGNNLEYIQGIHMLPLLPVSGFVRTPKFVAQEWNAIISSLAPTVSSGWKGVLYANLAISDAVSAWKFFSDPNFNSGWLDGGASLTWYLTYAAGLGGAGNFAVAVTAPAGQPQTTTVTGVTTFAPGATTTSVSYPKSTVTGTVLILPTSSSEISRTSSSVVSDSQTVVAPSSRTPSSSSTTMEMTTGNSATSDIPTSATLSMLSTTSISATLPVTTSSGTLSARSLTDTPATSSTAAISTPASSSSTDNSSSSTTSTIGGTNIGAGVGAPSNTQTIFSLPPTSTPAADVPTTHDTTTMFTTTTATRQSTVTTFIPVVQTTTTAAQPAGTTSAADGTAATGGQTQTGSQTNNAGTAGSTGGSTDVSSGSGSSTNSGNSGSSGNAGGSTDAGANAGQTGNTGSSANSGSSPASGSAGSTGSTDNGSAAGSNSGSSSGSGSTGSSAGVPAAAAPASAATTTVAVVPAVSAAPGTASPVGSNSGAAGSVGSSTGSGRQYTVSGTCKGQAFAQGYYVCWDDAQLCPIQNGVVFYNCAGACYDPSLYACPNGQVLVAASSSTPAPAPVSNARTGMQTCGAASYDAASYTCYGDRLCPIMGAIVTKLCSTDCYNPALYHCDPFAGLSQGGEVPSAPTVAAGQAVCGADVYDASRYTCYGSKLCPVVNGVKTLVCGSDCYDPSLYSCSAAGRLVAAA